MQVQTLSGEEGQESREARTRAPLLVNLDGALLRGDWLLEAALTQLRRDPFALLALLWGLLLQPAHWLRARRWLATNLAAVWLDPAALPYDGALLGWLKFMKLRGHRLTLVTAAPRALAQRISAHLGLFERVLASQGAEDGPGAPLEEFRAERRHEALVTLFGIGGFDYVGSGRADLPMWEDCRVAYLVRPSASISKAARAQQAVQTVPLHKQSRAQTWLAALHLEEWSANLLIFAPAVPLWLGAATAPADAALPLWPAWFNGEFAGRCMALLLLLGTISSLGHALADLLDARQTRSGQINAQWTLLACLLLPLPLLWLAGTWCGFAFALLAGTLALSYCRAILLRQIAGLDALCDATLYLLRYACGAAALGTSLSPTLLGVLTFFFLSLALARLYAAQCQRQSSGTAGTAPASPWAAEESPLLLAFGSVCGIGALLLLGATLGTLSSHFAAPVYLWLALLLSFYWLLRLWLFARRALWSGEPLTFALSDGPSSATLFLLLWALWLARG